jgi:hypothetical protein
MTGLSDSTRDAAARLLFSAVLASATAVLLLGCEEEKKSGHRVPVPRLGAETVQENLCTEIAKVMCYNVFECCTGQQIEARLGVELSTTESECRRDLELVCESGIALLLRALDPEVAHVEIDVEGVTACLEQLLVGEQGCFPLVMGSPGYLEACHEGLVLPLQAVGADCLADFECKGDAYCGPDRKCKAIPRLDEPCTNVCAEGLYCGENEDGDRVCVAFQGKGEPCTDGLFIPGEPLRLCGEDLYCRQDEQQPGEPPSATCQERKAIGENCGEDEPCKDGVCLWGACGDGSECRDDSDCRGECSESGNACDSDTDCRGTCDDGFMSSCNEDADCGGTCTVSGNYCGDDWDCGYGTCAVSGLYCYGEFDCQDGSCAVSGNTCYEDFYCDTGEECISNEECVPSETCQLSRCIHQQCIGASACENRICDYVWEILDYCQVGLEAATLVFGGEPDQGSGEGAGAPPAY